jgi:hypothetical protein
MYLTKLTSILFVLYLLNIFVSLCNNQILDFLRTIVVASDWLGTIFLVHSQLKAWAHFDKMISDLQNLDFQQM